MILNCLCKCLLFSINYSFCQYLSSLNILLKIDFTRWKSVELLHIVYTVIHNCFDNTCYLSVIFSNSSTWKIASEPQMTSNQKMNDSKAVVGYLTTAPYIFYWELSEAAAWRCSVKNIFLKIFAKFTGKYLCRCICF